MLLVFLLATVIVLQGCIEIVEEVTINENRSGSLSFTVQAGGGSNPLIALFRQYADMSFMDEIRDNAELVSRVLKASDGISNVRFTESHRNSRMILSFDFEDDKKLNQALYASAGIEKTFLQPNIYKIRNHKFVRKNTTGWIMKLMEQEQDHIPDEIIFDLVQIKSVYRIPNQARKIKVPENFVASQNGRTFTGTNFLSDLIDEKVNTRIKLRY